MEKDRKQRIIETLSGIGSTATGTVAGVMAGVAFNSHAAETPERNEEIEQMDDIEVVHIDNPGKPEPVKPEPVKPEPVKPEPIKPEPIKPVSPGNHTSEEFEVLDYQRVSDEQGNQYDVAVLRVNGTEVAVIDADLDGIADAMIMDYNGDGMIDQSEITDIQGQGIMMGPLAQAFRPDEPEGVAVLDYQRMTGPDGNEFDIAVLNVEGSEVAVIDADLDGEADAMMMDVNGDGQIDQSEVFDITDQHLAMQPLQDAFDGPINPDCTDMA